MQTRLHIIEFVWHDLGDWLNCYGRSEVRSPNVDSIAQNGVLFENHFCTAPQCSPSRATIKTGRYPQSHGVLGLTHRGWSYNEDERDWADVLGEHGYHTVLCGFQHERAHGSGSLSYHESISDTNYAEPASDAARRYIESWSGDKPLFMSIGFSEVHRPYGNEYSKETAAALTVPGYLPDVPVVRKDCATLCTNIQRADAAVGRVLQTLEESGMRDNTLIIFTTDHGPGFPRAKMTLYDPGVKVAFLMQLPGVLPAGRRVSALTSHVSVFPTVLDLAGIPVPERVQGRSFAQLAKGETDHGEDHVFAQMTWHAEYDPMRCIRTRRFKYIRNYRPGWPVRIGGHYTQRYGTDFVTEHFGQCRPAEELYDLESDPWEQTNCADDPRFATEKKALAARLERWMQDVDDPILRGHVPPANPARARGKALWGKFPPRDPVHDDFRVEAILFKEFNEDPV